MGMAAELALELRTNQKALALLDKICKPYEGCDAEFERTHNTQYTDTDQALGKLITEAFGGRKDWAKAIKKGAKAAKAAGAGAENLALDGWYDQVYAKFRKRYDLC
jgi:hypothetical protein